MMVAYALYGVAALAVALAPIAIALSASPRGTNVVYGASLIVTLTLCVMALLVLFGHSPFSRVALPLGLPWLGAHFRIDALAVTGPVSKNMREALLRTYNAMPDPKWVVAIGGCAVDGGLFAGSYAVAGGVKDVVPVDLTIPGCPPNPRQLLAGLLALLQNAA